MRRGLALALAVSAAAACADEEPQFADPGAIAVRKLPGTEGAEVVGEGGAPAGDFGGPYDPNANKPTTTVKAAHAGKAAPADPGFLTDCLGCHNGATPTTPAFAFGGRLQVAGTPDPAVNADVVVVNGDGARIGPVKTDADGYFWSNGAAKLAGARTSVRSAAGEKKMTRLLGDGEGGCSRAGICHGGSTGPAYAPK